MNFVFFRVGLISHQSNQLVVRNNNCLQVIIHGQNHRMLIVNT
jgi:hypothetical protein